MGFLFKAKSAFLDLVLPMRCFGCKKEGVLFCQVCRSQLYFVPPSCIICRKLVPGTKRTPPGRTCRACRKKSCIYAFLSPMQYQEDMVRDIIHALKYQRVRELDAVLAGALVDYIARFRIKLPKGAVIVPIPLHQGRRRTRGFNQAELIAERLGETLELPVRAGVLCKTKKTIPQVELSAEARRKNVISTFAAKNSAVVKDKIVFLLDDVKTTGATLAEAARVLKEAGAKRIWAITVAH